MTEQADDPREQARQLAVDSVQQALPESSDYDAELAHEETDAWVFLVRPAGRVRGGGARVIVAKKTGKVVETIFLQ